MCTNPITTQSDVGEITFSCRNCDECIATRKNEWVARGCAEFATSNFSMIVNLTYRNRPDGTLPRSARAFNYADVQNYIKRIRKAAFKTYGKGVEIRYIVCGERGSQKDRVHWHMVLFSTHDLSKLGKWFDFVFKSIPDPRPGKMDHWSFWEHGHVQTDTVDQRGLSYILKYCIKDQFNVVKARGTGRIAKAENTGAGMFRMSKAPPIGWRYIEHKLDRLTETLAVPPSTEINVEGYSGFWWPRGKIRQDYLAALSVINDTHLDKFGRNCPSWATLLASVSENEKDLEALNVLSNSENEETPEQLEERLFELQRQTANRQKHAATRAKCGNLTLCQRCFNSLDAAQRLDLKNWRDVQEQQFDQSPFGSTKEDYFRRENRPNPFCGWKDESEKAFTFSARYL